MNNADRRAAYEKQTARKELTPRQKRRLSKKAGQGKG